MTTSKKVYIQLGSLRIGKSILTTCETLRVVSKLMKQNIKIFKMSIRLVCEGQSECIDWSSHVWDVQSIAGWKNRYEVFWRCNRFRRTPFSESKEWCLSVQCYPVQTSGTVLIKFGVWTYVGHISRFLSSSYFQYLKIWGVTIIRKQKKLCFAQNQH